jgi:hypothetical protein
VGPARWCKRDVAVHLVEPDANSSYSVGSPPPVGITIPGDDRVIERCIHPATPLAPRKPQFLPVHPEHGESHRRPWC